MFFLNCARYFLRSLAGIDRRRRFAGTPAGCDEDSRSRSAADDRAGYRPSRRTAVSCGSSPRRGGNRPSNSRSRSFPSGKSRYCCIAWTTCALVCLNSACSFASFTSANASGTSFSKKADDAGQLLDGNLGKDARRILQVRARVGEDHCGILRSRATSAAQPFLRRCEVAPHQHERAVAHGSRVAVRIVLPPARAFQFEQRGRAHAQSSSRDRRRPSAESPVGWQRLEFLCQFAVRRDLLRRCVVRDKSSICESYWCSPARVPALGWKAKKLVMNSSGRQRSTRLRIHDSWALRVAPGELACSAHDTRNIAISYNKCSLTFSLSRISFFRRTKSALSRLVAVYCRLPGCAKAFSICFNSFSTSSGLVRFQWNFSTPCGVNCAPFWVATNCAQSRAIDLRLLREVHADQIATPLDGGNADALAEQLQRTHTPAGGAPAAAARRSGPPFRRATSLNCASFSTPAMRLYMRRRWFSSSM